MDGAADAFGFLAAANETQIPLGNDKKGAECVGSQSARFAACEAGRMG